ncbi:MAG TPA: DALR domain-containing protein, partial [Terriglobales bacterium]|nr:DALR domain-containing protein [Terriglobales bacterium]
GEAKWNTEIGPGRPGWHIECSVMSMEFLGETLDIHAGGEDLVFPHHENEIAQSESLTGKPFARYWLHVRFLLVEGEKMSKSLGNFYTLRDLVLKGHKPSAIRYLLASVPFRKQLNFTFDGLKTAANAVERLRNFKLRIETGKFEQGTNEEVQALAQKAIDDMRSGLDDDLNTAQAQGSIFEMVRDVNAAADAGQVKQGNLPLIMEALQKFDEIFGVLNDDDSEKMRSIYDWAKAEGRLQGAAEEFIKSVKSSELGDGKINALIAEMQAARKARNFARSDEIRNELNSAGIVVEITKDGARWKRK